VDGVLDQVTTRLPIKYVLLVGGYKLFPAGKISITQVIMGIPITYTYKTDSLYADNNRDSGNLPDVALGRLPDPNSGDIALLTAEFDHIYQTAQLRRT